LFCRQQPTAFRNREWKAGFHQGDRISPPGWTALQVPSPSWIKGGLPDLHTPAGSAHSPLDGRNALKRIAV
jgi:hypothetical protein